LPRPTISFTPVALYAVVILSALLLRAEDQENIRAAIAVQCSRRHGRN